MMYVRHIWSWGTQNYEGGRPVPRPPPAAPPPNWIWHEGAPSSRIGGDASLVFLGPGTLVVEAPDPLGRRGGSRFERSRHRSGRDAHHGARRVQDQRGSGAARSRTRQMRASTSRDGSLDALGTWDAVNLLSEAAGPCARDTLSLSDRSAEATCLAPSRRVRAAAASHRRASSCGTARGPLACRGRTGWPQALEATRARGSRPFTVGAFFRVGFLGLALLPSRPSRAPRFGGGLTSRGPRRATRDALFTCPPRAAFLRTGAERPCACSTGPGRTRLLSAAARPNPGRACHKNALWSP